jgi:DNA-binding response OmpR family regulator
MRRALVVEDDPDIVELVTLYLGKEGFQVDSIGDGRGALQKIRATPFDLLILDLQLPGIDGLTLCAEARRTGAAPHVPVVMLTARGDETDRIVGLEMGADDYVVKPFSPKELVARVRALFRRVDRRDEDGAAGVLRFGALELDGGRHVARWLLEALLRARGRVLSRQQLLEDVWGYSYAEGTRTVDVHIRRLREKLPGLAPSILTVKSLGYRLARDPAE